MSLQKTRGTVIQNVHDYLKLQDSTLAIAGENHPYPQPVNKEWVHVSFAPGRRFRTNIGTLPKWRQLGLFQVNIMVPKDTGTDRCWQIVDWVIDSLSDKSYTLDDGEVVKLYSADVFNRGVINGFFTVAVKFEFRKDGG